MLSRLNWLFLLNARRLWLRASLFALFGIASAMAAPLISPLLPSGWSDAIGRDALENILGIIATSMLVVATFSLSTMVAAYTAASTVTTPRIARLLMQDTHAQNALATFVGAFLFALVGILALSSGLYDGNGRFVLFVTTIFVVAVIVLTFVRWIDHVSHLGRVGDAIERVLEKAERALRDRHTNPWLGGLPASPSFPAHHAITFGSTGYVQYIDLAALEKIAEKAEGAIQIETPPGSLAEPTRPLARVSFAADEGTCEQVRNAFVVASWRSFEQDPRYGVIVLAEIAAKALSPGINDPGTAIEVIGAQARVLSICAEPCTAKPETLYPHVHVPPIDAAELLQDAFLPISQYGAGSLAVGIRLQKALLALSRMGDPDLARAARRESALALARARHALPVEEDIAQIAALAADVAEAR